MYFIEYFFIRLIAIVFGLIPLKMAETAAKFTAFLLRDVLHYRRSVIIENLNLVYGGQWPGPPGLLLKEIYRHFVYLWFEVLQASRFDFPQKQARIVLHDEKVVNEALAKGKGALLLTAHIGNFEWIGDWMGASGYKFAAVAKRQKNPMVDNYIRKLRERFGTKIVYTRQAMKQGLSLLRKQWIFGLVADQYAGEKGVEVSFLNLKTRFFAGPAIFHLRTGAPMFYVFGIRRSYARFDFHFVPVPALDLNEVSDDNIRKVTQLHASVLEKWLRAHPEQWFWSHKRWKNLTDYREAVHMPGSEVKA